MKVMSFYVFKYENGKPEVDIQSYLDDGVMMEESHFNFNNNRGCNSLAAAQEVPLSMLLLWGSQQL